MSPDTFGLDQLSSSFRVGYDWYPVSHIKKEDIITNQPLVYYWRKVRLDINENCWLSIVWGTFTYSDNYYSGFNHSPMIEEPKTVEVVMLKKAVTWQSPIDSLKYQTVADVQRLIGPKNTISDNNNSLYEL